MRRYLFNYQTKVWFDKPIQDHAVLLRCLPAHCLYQTVREEHMLAADNFQLQEGKDGFGNRILTGFYQDPHKTWIYQSCGIVEQTAYKVEPDDMPAEVYLAPSRMTTLKEDLRTDLVGYTEDKAMELCGLANRMLTYTPDSTTVETDVSEVLKLKKGVCQDYAHLMIALCRQAGIAARYACGFVEGTGLTHAWVEVFNGTYWTGFDPTCGKLIAYGYVKLAHGRDASDCPVNRGCYKSMANEENEINVSLEELT